MPLTDRDRELDAETWIGNGLVQVEDEELPWPFSVPPLNELPSHVGRTPLVVYLGFPAALALAAFITMTGKGELTFFTALSVGFLTIVFSSHFFRATAIHLACGVKTVGQGAAFLRSLPKIYFAFLALYFVGQIATLFQEGNSAEASAGLFTWAVFPWLVWRVARWTVKPEWHAPQSDRVIQRGEAMVSAAEARKRVERAANGKELIPWGVGLPPGAETRHFLLLGAPGSGKTLIMKFMMNWVVGKEMQEKDDVRALVYDAKQDIMSYLAPLGRGNVPVISLHPFDARCSPWDISTDIDDPSGAQELAAAMLPLNPNANQPYFNEAGQDILTGVLGYFLKYAPRRWTLRDVILATEDAATAQAILEKSPSGRGALAHFQRDKGAHEIISTIRTYTKSYQFIAAAWHNAEGPPVSIRNWLEGSGVIVLGHSEANRAALDTINRLFFKRASQLTLNGREVSAETDTRRTWFFLDEIREMGQLEGFDSLLTRGRSKGACVMIGFQDIGGLRDVYGHDHAEEIAGLCGNKCFLRLEDAVSAKWASELFATAEVKQFEEQFGEQFGRDHSTSVTRSWNYRDVEVLKADELLTMAQTSLRNGLPAYYKSAETGKYRGTYSGDSFDRYAPMLDPSYPAFVERPSAHQELLDWDDADLERLQLQFLRDENSAPKEVTPTSQGVFGGLDSVGD